MKPLVFFVTIFIKLFISAGSIELNEEINRSKDTSVNVTINGIANHSEIPPLPPPLPLGELIRKIDNIEEIDEKEGLKYRLPKNVVPKYYAIKITPHMIPGNFTFDGFVEITTQVVQTSTEIVLHIDNITIESVNLESNGSSVQISNVSRDEKHHFLRITAAKTIISGSEIIIQIKYLGYMNEEKRGLYRNFYVDKFNQTKWFAVTHLLPIGARRVFPCFDEPALRATFQLNVSRTADFKALSITKLNSTIKENDRHLDIFEKTPVVTTYSVALIMSEFTSANETWNYFDWTNDSPSEAVQSDIGRNFNIFKFYEDFWRHKNQLENWNLITYNDNTIIINPNYVSAASRQTFAYGMIYEIAFGYNGFEVSSQWWNNGWFIIGRSAYHMSTVMESTLDSYWDGDGQFVVEQLQPSLLTDAFPSSHPLTHDVYSPNQIIGIFDYDYLSYFKGASIKRALKYITKDFFMDAVNALHSKKRWQCMEPNDMFSIFQKKLNESTSIKLNTSVKTMMDSWIMQAGFPVVHVKINKSIATLSQERFLLTNPDKIPTNQLWWIPITWTSSLHANFSDTNLKYLLGKAVDQITVHEVDDNGWIVFNIRHAGYYRVNYDDKSWSRLIKTLKSPNFGKIESVNRAVLLDDLLNLARAGYVNYATALPATQYLTQETDYIAWKAAFNNFVFLDKQIIDKNTHDLFKNYVLKLIEHIYKKVGFKDYFYSYFNILLKANIFDWACKCGNHHCIENSLRSFNDWKSNPSQLVPVNTRGTVFCTAIKYGLEDNWEYLWNKYLETNYQTEKITIINALACTKNEEKLRQLLLNAIDRKSGLRYEDSLTTFSAVYSSGRLGAKQALDIISEHYDDIYNYYNNDYNKIKTILKGLSSHLTTIELVSQFIDFANKHSDKIALINKAVLSYISEAKEDLKWYDKYSPSIANFLSRAVGDYRTPEYPASGTIYPTKYNINLIPNITNSTIYGGLKAKLYITKTTSKMILDAKGLNILDIKLVYADTTKSVNIFNYSYDANNKLIINLDSPIEIGSWLTISFKYTGNINIKTEAFYKNSYNHNIGQNLWIATKDQKYGVSQIFPCFDEPETTAGFLIMIRKPNNYKILSSMKLLSFTSLKTFNSTWGYYKAINLMPPYNIVFLLTEFEKVDKYNNTNIPVEGSAVTTVSEKKSIINTTSEVDPVVSTTSSTKFIVNSTFQDIPVVNNFSTKSIPNIVSSGEFVVNSTSGDRTIESNTSRDESVVNITSKTESITSTTSKNKSILNSASKDESIINTTSEDELIINTNQHMTKIPEFEQKILNFLGKYTGIQYPVDKMDLDAVPDYDVSTVESSIPATGSELLPNAIATIINYVNALVKIWLDEVVPPGSKDYNWLNKGLAKYFQWIVLDKLQPKSKLIEYFTVYELQKSLLMDSFIDISPVNNTNIGSNKNNKYSKVASIFHMIQHAFGEELFQESFKDYLQEGRKKLAKTLNVSRPYPSYKLNKTKIEKIPKKTFSALIDNWIKQAGYPVVYAESINDTLNLRQERFLITGKNSSSKELYWIPITIATESKPDFSNTFPILWLEGEHENIKDALNITDKWFILNIQQTGFYRVNYDQHSWNNLIDTLKNDNFERIPEINRAQIIDDLLNLARADYIPYDIALNGTEYLRKEKSHLPWKAFFNAVLFLYERFDGRPVGENLKAYLSMLIHPIYEELGFEEKVSDNQFDKLNRQLILSWACKLGYPDCVDTSIKLFNEWRANSTKFISPDVKQTVFCTAIKYGDKNDWQLLWETYLESTVESEKITMLNALGCSKDNKIIDKYLNYAISGDGSISDKHVAIIFESVYSSGPFGVDATLNFLKENFQALYEHYGIWDPVAELFIDLAAKMTSNNQISQLLLLTHLKQKELYHISKTLNESIVSAAENVKWYDQHVANIEARLKSEEISTTSFHDYINNRKRDVVNTHPIFIISILLAITAFVISVIAISYYCLQRKKTYTTNM